MGGFYFESEVQETFTCKRNSWRNYAISDGGGAVAHASPIEVFPSKASDNTVEVYEDRYIINDETTLKGNYEYIFFGGYSNNSDSSNINTVKIYSGYTNYIYGGYSLSGKALGNEVYIDGGTIGTIYGGYAPKDSSSGNTVYLYGGNIGNIYGGYSENGRSASNILEIHTTGLTAQNISDFQIIKFYLPSNVDTTTPVLTLSATSTYISGAQVLAGVEGNANLNNGDVITLLTNNGTITTDGTTYGKLTEGVSLTYDLTVSKDGDNKIIATIGSVSTPTPDPTPEVPTTPDDNPTDPIFNPKTEILTKFPIQPQPPEPPPLPEQDFDFEEEGLDGFFKENESSWEVFGDMGAGPMRYKVNNGHIDTTNQNADLGLARKLGGDSHLMTIAPIIDYQNTNYDTYLNDGTRARGNSKYTGGGFVLRNMNKNGFYFETSLRGGKTKTDFASEDLDTTGNFGTITYDTSQTIWNGHLKLGKYLRLNKNNLLHVYGFYYHTHQGGSNADLSSGEHYNFSSANAGRARIGYRMTTRTSKISQIYTGLAYQFEHNSGVTAKYKNFGTDGKSHNGSSGMLEIGWIIKPLKDNPWAVDINATGWIGNQRGVKAMAKVQKSF